MGTSRTATASTVAQVKRLCKYPEHFFKGDRYNHQVPFLSLLAENITEIIIIRSLHIYV